jgi:hypothetical protein
MLLAKVALGCAGTLLLAGAYTFREGIMSVQEDCAQGHHVHVWLPAAVVPMALHVVPAHYTEHAAAQVAPFLPTIRALAKELKRYPNAELVEVRDSEQHVRVRTNDGKLLIDVDSPEENVHVVCPLATIEDVSRELTALAPAA